MVKAKSYDFQGEGRMTKRRRNHTASGNCSLCGGHQVGVIAVDLDGAFVCKTCRPELFERVSEEEKERWLNGETELANDPVNW